MKPIACILSTKKLNTQQKQWLLNANLSVMEVDFIQVQPQTIHLKSTPSLLLFTSKNAIKSVVSQENIYTQIQGLPCICVGTKTKNLAEKNGFKVLQWAHYAEELATKLSPFAKEHIAFFAGNLRRDTLPNALKTQNILFEEYTAYTTTPKSHKINATYDAVLFFSPSAVHSFFEENTLTEQYAFCIGTTTTDALKKHTTKYFVAHKPTIENTIIQCIKQLNPKYITKK